MSSSSTSAAVNSGVVIIGAGHAGTAMAANLRQFGYAGDITLLGEELAAPYHRPPLSKAWLLGKSTTESIALRPATFYRDQNINLVLGERVSNVDRAARTVELASSGTRAYDWLVLATGARPRRLPWCNERIPNLFQLRSVLDAEALKKAIVRGARVVIVGAGYIGLEAAASAREMGAEVTVIERESRVLARVACEELSQFYEAYHRARGVTILLGRSVEAVECDSDQRHRIKLDDGRALEADATLLGVGAVPNQELAATMGLECGDGIFVDGQARTSDPSIFAIGDCSRRPVALYGQHLRLESVGNALEQSKQAAAAICGQKQPTPEVPWFWSDQYGIKLQIAGLNVAASYRVLRGSTDKRQFAIFHLNASSQLQCVEAVNAPTEFVAGRALIAERKPVQPALLANTNVSMKEVAG